MSGRSLYSLEAEIKDARAQLTAAGIRDDGLSVGTRVVLLAHQLAKIDTENIRLRLEMIRARDHLARQSAVWAETTYPDERTQAVVMEAVNDLSVMGQRIIDDALAATIPAGYLGNLLITSLQLRDALARCSTVGWPVGVQEAFYRWQTVLNTISQGEPDDAPATPPSDR